MERRITQIRSFSKSVEGLIRKKKLQNQDFATLKQRLVEDPQAGDVIPGTGGIRKIRIKSSF